MAYFNKVTMLCNLTRDPEVKQSPNGMALCSFGVASNRSFKNKQSGEFEKDVCFIDVNVWGSSAEQYGQSLKKGQEVLLEGRLKLNTWQDNSGVKHTKHLIIADRVISLTHNPSQTENLGKSSQPSFGNQQSASSNSATSAPWNSTQFRANSIPPTQNNALNQNSAVMDDVPF